MVAPGEPKGRVEQDETRSRLLRCPSAAGEDQPGRFDRCFDRCFVRCFVRLCLSRCVCERRLGVDGDVQRAVVRLSCRLVGLFQNSNTAK